MDQNENKRVEPSDKDQRPSIATFLLIIFSPLYILLFVLIFIRPFRSAPFSPADWRIVGGVESILVGFLYGFMMRRVRFWEIDKYFKAAIIIRPSISLILLGVGLIVWDLEGFVILKAVIFTGIALCIVGGRVLLMIHNSISRKEK